MLKGIPNDCLIVVADGTRAVLFRQVSQGANIKLRHDTELTPSNLEDDGPAGVRPPESSKQETDQATFAKQLAHAINERALTQKFDDLVLIVDPQTLGQMRPSLHQEVEDRLRAEIAKNVVNAPIEDIKSLLESSLED